MPHPRYTTEEIVRRGEEIYQERIRPLVEPEHHGKFLVVDVETGDYALGPDELTAADRLQERRPDAVIYLLRVGHPTAVRLGGAFQVGQP